MSPRYNAGQFKGGRKAASKRQSNQQPTSESDFLEEGAAHEASGGKWRAGDVMKSARFFQRATTSYDNGLATFPQSWDLAFSKAHLMLELTDHPRILEQFGKSIPKFLEDTLGAHRVALQLDPESTETLFNTAQVLTELAKERGKDEKALGEFEEAKILLERCLSLQEKEYLESESGEEQGAAPMATNNDASIDESEVYVTESISPRDIVDTIIALVSTLEETYTRAKPGIPELETQYRLLDNLDSKIKPLIAILPSSLPPSPSPPTGPTLTLSISTQGTLSPQTSPDPQRSPQEVAAKDWILALIIARCAALDATYRSNHLLWNDYHEMVSSQVKLLTPTASAVSTDPETASALADIFTAFATSMLTRSTFWDQWQREERSDSALAVWQALVATRDLLHVCGKTPNVLLAQVDNDLLMLRLAKAAMENPLWLQPTVEPNMLVQSARDALVNLQGVVTQRGSASRADEIEAGFVVRQALVEVAAGVGISPATEQMLNRTSRPRAESVLVEMVDDGLVVRDVAEAIASKLA